MQPTLRLFPPIRDSILRVPLLAILPCKLLSIVSFRTRRTLSVRFTCAGCCSDRSCCKSYALIWKRASLVFFNREGNPHSIITTITIKTVPPVIYHFPTIKPPIPTSIKLTPISIKPTPILHT
uniref:Uncharacterized protein n=1 Tax=Cacopsylla melanoneura TaxID=428564 RepID=A0A8D8Y9G6_9HEMI